MAYPATPKVSGQGTPASINASCDGMKKHHVNSKGKNFHVDSSPASTSGETATGDSVPVTPKEAAAASGEGGLSKLEAVLKNTHLERMWAKEVLDMQPSSEELAALFEQPTSASSPADVGYDSEGNTRNTFRKKHGVEFVKGETISSDPFVSTGSTSHKKAASEKSSSPSAADKSFSGDTPASVKYRPRGDRALQEICSDNAQAVLPPLACVFIANLSNSLSDSELQRTVEDRFSQFGVVYVKIKRDTRGMPFAFAQYENAACAERAIEEGRGLVINGRACRTERAKVNRSLYLSAVNGNPISEAEARELLGGHGALEKVWHCTDTEKQMHRLPEGIWVMFAFFQDARDAQNKFKEIPQYSLENPQSGDSVPPRVGSGVKTPSSPWVTSPWSNQSVQVSNLPGDATIGQIRALFDHVSTNSIAHVELSTGASLGNAEELTAIVTFRRYIAVESILAATYALGGKRLSLKAFRWPRADMHARQRVSMYSGSPSHNRRPRMNVHRDRAIAMGLSPTYVAAIFDDPPHSAPVVYNGMYNLGHPVLTQGNAPTQFPTYSFPGTGNNANGNSQMYPGPTSMNDIQAAYYNPLPGYPTTATIPYYPTMQTGYAYPQVANGHATTSTTDTSRNATNGDQN